MSRAGQLFTVLSSIIIIAILFIVRDEQQIANDTNKVKDHKTGTLTNYTILVYPHLLLALDPMNTNNETLIYELNDTNRSFYSAKKSPNRERLAYIRRDLARGNYTYTLEMIAGHLRARPQTIYSSKGAMMSYYWSDSSKLIYEVNGHIYRYDTQLGRSLFITGINPMSNINVYDNILYYIDNDNNVSKLSIDQPDESATVVEGTGAREAFVNFAISPDETFILYRQYSMSAWHLIYQKLEPPYGQKQVSDVTVELGGLVAIASDSKNILIEGYKGQVIKRKYVILDHQGQKVGEIDPYNIGKLLPQSAYVTIRPLTGLDRPEITKTVFSPDGGYIFWTAIQPGAGEYAFVADSDGKGIRLIGKVPSPVDGQIPIDITW